MSDELFLFPPKLDSDGFILLDLDYPRNTHRPNGFEIGLMDVRSADSIRVLYDFARDGSVIQQYARSGWFGDAEHRVVFK